MKSSRTSSTRRSSKNALLLAGLALSAAAVCVLSICVGAASVPLRDVLAALLGRQSGTAQTQIILFARLPRTLGCLLAGTALAVSGAVIQSVLDNPLAAPNIIGVNTGAGLMVALCGTFLPLQAVPAAAFCGAMAGVLLVLVISRRSGASRLTLVLAGVAVSHVFSAGIDAIVTFSPDTLNGYTDFRIGGLTGLTMGRLVPAFWVILVSMALVLLLSGEMDVLQLGDEMAQSLGLSVRRIRLVLLALASALAGAAVSFAGLLGFVGLIVPHIVRRVTGGGSFMLLLSSALGGAVMLTLCDILARTLFAPYEIPVGIVLSVLGGPFFIWLLLRQRGGRIHD